MAVHLIQVTMDHDSGLSEDRIVNTFHFEGDSTDLVIDNAFDMISDFYSAVPTGETSAIDSRLSSRLAGTRDFRAYNLEDAPPRVPVHERLDVAFTPGASAFPQEVAVVFSFQADQVSGISQARRRNRIYLGPWAASEGVDGRVSPTDIGIMVAAGRDMKQASDAAINMKWVVYSPTIAGPESTGNPPPNVAGAFALVTNGWVDNAWDTQRRRGRAATTRTTFTASTP